MPQRFYFITQRQHTLTHQDSAVKKKITTAITKNNPPSHSLLNGGLAETTRCPAQSNFLNSISYPCRSQTATQRKHGCLSLDNDTHQHLC